MLAGGTWPLRAPGKRMFQHWRRKPAARAAPGPQPGGAAPASSASLLVAITFHYVASRLFYLLDVVRALADFPVQRLDVIIVTNTTAPSERNSISDLLAPLLHGGKTVEVLPCPALAHPHDLAWAHKPLISGRFLAAGSGYTHFIYLEDDTRFGYANFCYFAAFRPKLAPSGLVPSFVRTEFSLRDGRLYSTDFLAPFTPDGGPCVAVDNYRFCAVDFPYCGLFVLDRELAAEHLASAAFRPESSISLAPEWPIRERAAMGLCWTAPPPGFRARYVVPVERNSGVVPGCCWVAHLPNNYANDPTTPYGKIPMSELASVAAASQHVLGKT